MVNAAINELPFSFFSTEVLACWVPAGSLLLTRFAFAIDTDDDVTAAALKADERAVVLGEAKVCAKPENIGPGWVGCGGVANIDAFEDV